MTENRSFFGAPRLQYKITQYIIQTGSEKHTNLIETPVWNQLFPFSGQIF
jgi:hypothetical protein